AGDPDAAVDAFRGTLKLDDTVPVQYDLGRALAAKGDSKAAQQILQSITRDDPQYALAQQFLATLALNDSSYVETQRENVGAPEAARDRVQAAFADGQFQYQNANYGAALEQLEEALKLVPQAPWATKARIYRAICLEKLARTDEAEAAMRELLQNPAARDD